jgi:hypothetical protein
MGGCQPPSHRPDLQELIWRKKKVDQGHRKAVGLLSDIVPASSKQVNAMRLLSGQLFYD